MFYIVIGLIIFSYLVSTGLSILNYKNRNQELPEEVKDIYDESEYKKWHEYFMEGFKYAMVVRTIYLVITIVLLAIKSYKWFDDLATSLTDSAFLQLAIFLFIYYIISFVLGIFTSYYETFVIEEKYGFNKSTKKTFTTDKLKSFILTIIFAGGLILGLFALYRNFGIMFYVYGWVSLIVIILVVNMIYVKVLMPIFNKITPLEDGELKDEIQKFAEGVGYTVSKISVMDASRRTSRLNAMFTGFGKFKHILLFDTLIEKMSTEEIVAVLAHEIGHNKHKHIIVNLFTTFLQLGIYFGLLMVLLTNLVFSESFGFTAIHFGFSLVLFFEFIQVFDIFFAPLINGMIRKGEYQADRYAATKYKKEPMISALKVLSRENFSNLTPHPLFVKIRYSHPPTYQRIRAINKT